YFLFEYFGNVISDDRVSRRSRHDDFLMVGIQIHHSAVRSVFQRTSNCQDRLPDLAALWNVPGLELSLLPVVIDQSVLRRVDRDDAARIHDSSWFRVSLGSPIEDQNFAFAH